MTSTEHLDLPFLQPGQALKYITHNHALAQLDAVVQLSIKDIATDPESLTPDPGDRWIIGENPTDLWTGLTGYIARWEQGAWAFTAPKTGWRAWSEAAASLLVFRDGTWTPWAQSPDASQTLGVNTQADSTNRLAVKSDVILHSHDDVTPGSGNAQHVLNKIGPDSTAAFLMQSGYSGRAELGLIGDDNLSLKVSADGQNWTTAMIIDGVTGEVSFPASNTVGPQNPDTDPDPDPDPEPQPDVAYDRYVDPVTGQDSNEGTEGAAWASFAPLRTYLNSRASTDDVTVHIAAALYENDHIDIDSLRGRATLTFEPGAEIRQTIASGGSAIQANGTTDAHMSVIGNGLIIDGFNDGDGNGLGSYNASFYASGVTVRNCLDGASAHGASQVEFENCQFLDCTKFAAAHVQQSTSLHRNCVFRCTADAAGGIITTNGFAPHIFENCRIESPDGQTMSCRGSDVTQYIRCQIGTLTQPVRMETANVSDSFVNVTLDGSFTAVYERVFGFFSLRLRNNGNVRITDSVFTGPTAGGGFLWSNFDPGSFGLVDIQNCVITGYNTAIGFQNADRAAYWEASGSTVDNCALFGNTNNFGTHAAAQVGETITNLVASVTMGAGETVSMADYAVTDSDAGFAPTEVVTVGVVP